MRQIIVLLVAALLLGACNSYKEEWLQSQRRLQETEVQVTALEREVKARDQAIRDRDKAIQERDQALEERDRIIREQCVAKPKSAD
jgi:Tfp pilus assembly protein PilN